MVTPVVTRLANEIQVKLSNQHAITDSTQALAAATVGGRHVGRAIKVSKLCLGRFSVTTGEAVRKLLGADPVDGAHEIRIRNGRISRLNGPKRLTQAANGGAWIEHNFSTVQAKHHPIQRVVAAVANVDGNFAVYGVKHGMAVIALHVVPGQARNQRQPHKRGQGCDRHTAETERHMLTCSR